MDSDGEVPPPPPLQPAVETSETTASSRKSVGRAIPEVTCKTNLLTEGMSRPGAATRPRGQCSYAPFTLPKAGFYKRIRDAGPARTMAARLARRFDTMGTRRRQRTERPSDSPDRRAVCRDRSGGRGFALVSGP